MTSVYNLIEYSDNYAEKSSSLWQQCRDEQDDSDSDLILTQDLEILMIVL